jgi:dipeptidyl aminopeptidase/acylaminoacyl peptidase
MSRRPFASALVLVTALLIAGSAGAQMHPFNVHDMVAMHRISDPQPSPDGGRVAFSVTTMDLEANKGRRDIWLAATDGSGAARFTTHVANESSPRWADDSVLYFLSSRSGSNQVWRMRTDGGEATQVTDLPLDVEALNLGPGGEALYVGLSVFPDCADPIPCTVDRLAETAARKTTGRVYDRLFVRHWDTWEDGRRNHVFKIALDKNGMQSGEAVDLMAGVDGNCPTKPFGGAEDYTISPDGKWLVYTAKVIETSEVAWSTNWDVWAVATDGKQPPKNLTADNMAWDAAPSFSPDGKTLAYLAMARPGYESDRYRVVLMDWPGGSRRVLTEDWDRSPGGVAWSADGTTLYATAAHVGTTTLFTIDATTGKVSELVNKHTNSSPHPLPDGSVLFSQDSLISPDELYTVDPASGAVNRVTDLNGARLAEIQFGEYEQFSFTGAHGDTVYGYAMKPVNFEPGTKYPLAFLVHGGPQGSFDDHWHYRWNPQIYAGHGYAMVMIDFHGSVGYGQAFTDAINGDWGGAPYEDLMTGLDVALERYPWIDGDRMTALGASFGGYMINWIQGNTDRFKALVCHDGNLDEFMAYFDTEELWFPEWENGGTPWEKPESYRKHSPANKVQNWKTPELVIHGALDFRVVETQGLGTFNALQRMGVPSKLLYFPDENHWVLKPLNSIQWHEVVLDWLDQWTSPE